MMKRIFLSLSIMLLTAATAVAQMMNPVHFTAELRMLENSVGLVAFRSAAYKPHHAVREVLLYASKAVTELIRSEVVTQYIYNVPHTYASNSLTSAGVSMSHV